MSNIELSISVAKGYGGHLVYVNIENHQHDYLHRALSFIAFNVEDDVSIDVEDYEEDELPPIKLRLRGWVDNHTGNGLEWNDHSCKPKIV